MVYMNVIGNIRIADIYMLQSICETSHFAKRLKCLVISRNARDPQSLCEMTKKIQSLREVTKILHLVLHRLPKSMFEEI